MKKHIAAVLAVLLLFTLTACGGSERAVAITESEEQISLRAGFDTVAKSLYSGINAYALGESTLYNKTDIKAFGDINEVLTDSAAKGIKTVTLVSVGDYSVYAVATYLDVFSTGERRVYFDKIVAKNDGGVMKPVSQSDVPAEIQEQIITRLNENGKAADSFLKDSLKEFSGESASFKDWYNKRKSSLKIYNSGYNFSLEVKQPVVIKSLSGKTVVFFGDSITAGNSYVNLIGIETECTAVNSGVGGDSTRDAKKRFKTDVLDKNADVVVIALGMNDQAAVRYNQFSVNVTVAEYKENLSYFIDEIYKQGAKVVLCTPHKVCTEPGYYMYNMDKSDWRYDYTDMSIYANAVRELANEKGTYLADMFNAFDTYENSPILYSDGIHINSNGDALYCEKISEVLRSIEF